ncbi:uncharacterized protein F5891DRAFT_1186892 [Suillus fuscotomentosus]|uniref:DUF6699 domain-containing protein n=1 Tax=Suillus fuscotomentosus TaxID=1912939 RepID=A0AAD4EBF1_9AGAM|nr:uncharacterized protein F5891DRAFT_1186892 [Suillus fuscotomentosus]KAG1901863.1 hypothetical protein F5891DRAFT_1186892 [Suillus fuscotomentosus]
MLLSDPPPRPQPCTMLDIQDGSNPQYNFPVSHLLLIPPRVISMTLPPPMNLIPIQSTLTRIPERKHLWVFLTLNPATSLIHGHGTVGVPGTRTTAQHDTENAGLIHRHFTRRMMPSNLDTQKAFPHPFLAPPSVPLIYDLRHPPTSLRFPPSSPFADCGYELLRVPLTLERPKQIRLISPYFPWAFDIGPSAGEEVVTCLDVLSTLHAALQRPLTDTEWGAAGDDKRASLIRARDRRLRIQPVLHGSSNPAAPARPTVSFEKAVPRQQEPLLLRVDWLGSSVAFIGLVKDEAFARKRFVPGGREHPETWMVKFQIL